MADICVTFQDEEIVAIDITNIFLFVFVNNKSGDHNLLL